MRLMLSVMGGMSVMIIGLILNWLGPDFQQRVFSSAKVKVIDGDTIILGRKRIRLQGIDAPEMKQICQMVEDNITKDIRCGVKAMEALSNLIKDKSVECTDEGNDRYKRTLSYCFVEGININRLMVRQGYALAYVRYDNSFMLDEIMAQVERQGVWGTSFRKPWEWRKGHN